MNKISAVIIAKNAEDVIADCIDSVSFCDEVIVVDDKSTDRTAQIADYKGARVIEYSSHSFAEKRNYVIKKAKFDWLLYVDADERVTADLRESIQKNIEQTEVPYGAFTVTRKNYYLGKHEWPVTEKLERLFKKKLIKGWHGELHETASFDGTLGELDGFLLHYTHRDLGSMLNKTIVWSDTEARLRFDAHHPKMTWWRFPRVMATAFYDSYIKQKGYTIGTAGLIESLFQAFSMFITYAKLWELQQGRGKKHESTTSL